MTDGNTDLDGIDNFGPVELAAAIQQPLTAACNYIGAARLLLRSPAKAPDVVDKLEEAELQILRAGEIIRHFQRTASKRKS